MSSSVDQTAAAYNKQAKDYAKMVADELSKDMYTLHLPKLAKDAPAGGAVVDVGCGPGDCLALLSKDVKDGTALVGTDISDEMLKIARERVPTATFHNATATSLPLGDGEASAVMSYFVLHHLSLEDIGSALREWRRVLRSDGRLLLAVWSSGEFLERFAPRMAHKSTRFQQRMSARLRIRPRAA